MSNCFCIEDGSIYNKTTKSVLLDPAIIMMNDIGSPLRIGEYKELQNYFNSIPKEVNKDLSLIQFDKFEFSNEEICKFLNYLLEYTIGKEKWEEIKLYNKDQLKEFINKIYLDNFKVVKWDEMDHDNPNLISSENIKKFLSNPDGNDGGNGCRENVNLPYPDINKKEEEIKKSELYKNLNRDLDSERNL